MRPLRSGNANVVRPSPPYVVPSSAKSASFWEIGSCWPSQNAHPRGANVKPNIRISPSSGVDTGAPPSGRSDRVDDDLVVAGTLSPVDGRGEQVNGTDPIMAETVDAGRYSG